MPDTPTPGTGRGLDKKIGGIKVKVWLGLIAVALIVGLYLRSRATAAGEGDSADLADVSPIPPTGQPPLPQILDHRQFITRTRDAGIIKALQTIIKRLRVLVKGQQEEIRRLKRIEAQRRKRRA